MKLTATAERPITPAYCNKHGYRVYESVCSICAGTSNLGVLANWLSFKGDVPTPLAQTGNTFSLESFLAEVRDSCTNHAERKGYTAQQGSDEGDIFGQILRLTGVAKDHAFGEIVAKLLEYKKQPRRVLAVKIAGWAWRLWLNTEK